MALRIAIVGAGAVGAYVGDHLARDGLDVVLIDAWPAHVEAMNGGGLQLEGLSEAECFTTPVRAPSLTDVQSLARTGPVNMALVCMKSYDTAWATHLIKDYLAPGGFVVSLQNCINEDTIASIVGWGRTVGCSEAFIPSMAQDVNKGRRTEVDYINGVVVSRGQELGIEAPANAGLAEAVRRVERGETPPSLDLLRGI